MAYVGYIIISQEILTNRKAVKASKRMSPTHVDFLISYQIGEKLLVSYIYKQLISVLKLIKIRTASGIIIINAIQFQLVFEEQDDRVPVQ